MTLRHKHWTSACCQDTVRFVLVGRRCAFLPMGHQSFRNVSRSHGIPIISSGRSHPWLQECLFSPPKAFFAAHTWPSLPCYLASSPLPPVPVRELPFPGLRLLWPPATTSHNAHRGLGLGKSGNGGVEGREVRTQNLWMHNAEHFGNGWA